ncbi:Rho GTPase-activating protein 7 [Apodemus speciosus]|uniref:Rho GTPase-activating protein 7 n=1 Tax=Apodemus speciosus TaxID=105296 RepID=A0ABQ0F1W4_APOSI
MGDSEGHVMARPLRGPLRRSFSDHIRDSTARALDAIWKNTRERRLAARLNTLNKCAVMKLEISPHRKRMGHMPEWYSKSFGHLCAAEVVKIRDSFSNQNTETKDTRSR